MKFRKMLKILLVLSVVLMAMLMIAAEPSTEAMANGVGTCNPDYDDKDESAPFDHDDFSVPAGQVIKQVNIKTGTLGCLEDITVDGLYHDGCYLVTGIGTSSILVERVGEPGPDCQEISHTEIELGDAPPPEPSMDYDTTQRCEYLRVDASVSPLDLDDLGRFQYYYLLFEIDGVRINPPGYAFLMPWHGDTLSSWAQKDLSPGTHDIHIEFGIFYQSGGPRFVPHLSEDFSVEIEPCPPTTDPEMDITTDAWCDENNNAHVSVAGTVTQDMLGEWAHAMDISLRHGDGSGTQVDRDPGGYYGTSRSILNVSHEISNAEQGKEYTFRFGYYTYNPFYSLRTRHYDEPFTTVTAPTCYQACDLTTTLDKIYGDWYDVGDPVWGPWIDNGDGTFTAYGTQVTARDWTQVIVDFYDENHVCDTDSGTEPGEQEVEKTVWASCEQTVALDKIYGDWYDVGDPVWGPWIDNGDGTFTAYGTQVTARDWTQDFVDSEFPTHVCDTDGGTEPGEREVSKNMNACEGERVWLPKEYGDWYDVNGIDWGPWIDDLKGTSIRYGFQHAAVDWVQYQVDAMNHDYVCDVREGMDEGGREVYQEKCSPHWTGRWITLYRQIGSSHFFKTCGLLVPEIAEADLNGDGKIDEKEAKAWEWSDTYIGDMCSLSCETQDWKGVEVWTNMEMKTCDGTIKARYTDYEYTMCDGNDDDICIMLEALGNGPPAGP